MEYNETLSYNGNDELIVTIVMVYLVIAAAVFIISLADYIIRGIGMYKMGKAKGKTNPWLAFVPYARTYFQGNLGGSIDFQNKSIKNPGLWLLLLPIINSVVTGIITFIYGAVFTASAAFDVIGDADMLSEMGGTSIVFIIVVILVGFVFTTAATVLRVLVNRQIYSQYTVTNMAVLHAVLGSLLPLYESIALLIYGKKAEEEKEQNNTDYSNPQYTGDYHEPVQPEIKEVYDVKEPEELKEVYGIKEPEEIREVQEDENDTIQ